jgi:hypothetical protein
LVSRWWNFRDFLLKKEVRRSRLPQYGRGFAREIGTSFDASFPM